MIGLSQIHQLDHCRKIYAAGDAALQLDGFYSEIALPLFQDVSFKYLDDAVKVDTIVKSRWVC